MRFSLVLSILPLAISVGALNITEPTKGDDLDVTNSFTVKWSSVNTDPSTVDIVLVNNHIYPNFEQTLASDIDTSKGSYTASGLKDVTHGSGFQINLMSTSKENTGILAQSQQFEVTEPAKSSSEASTTGTSSTLSSSTSPASSVGTSTSTSISTGASTTETEVSTTGTLTPGIPTIETSLRPSTSEFHAVPIFTTARNSTDMSFFLATGKTTATENATSTTKASVQTGLTTSASTTTKSADSTSASTSASPIHSEGAGMALAAPGAAAGLLAGLLALNL
ncbi:Cell wall beta-glucan synthesis [Penicillium sp. IBT 31633x]|nr:Cell wall beta-glucan synthesis [Penicillium sp. IBT 31633x]